MKNLLLLTTSLLALACGSRPNNAIETRDSNGGTIKMDGSSTVYLISEAVAEEFRNTAPEVKITMGMSGTGGGFKKFSRGETDINNASRPIKFEEEEKCRLNAIEYIELLVAYDGLVIAVNPANDWVKEISISELKKIWEPEAQGKIKTWNQIRSEWPNKEIHLYGPGVESGTYDYFTEAIIGKSHTSRGDYTGSEDDNILVQGVSGDKLALGFFGFAFYQENKSKLKIIPVNNDKANKGKGAIEPSIESIMNRTYAPLSRPLYLYVNSKETQRKEIVSFVEFYLKHATSLSKSVGFVPLREEEYKTQLEHFSSFVKQGR